MSNETTLPEDDPQRGAGFSTLGRDPLTLAGGAILAAIALLYLLPVISRERLAEWSGAVFLLPLSLWMAAAALTARRRIEHPEERRFWAFLGFGFASWSAAMVLTLLPGWEQSHPLLRLLYDLFAATFGLSLILASAESPHLDPGWSRGPRTQLVVYLGALVFGLGMTVYYDLLPYLLDRAAFESRVPAFYLFLALDLAFLVRALSLFLRAPNRAWRIVYGALLATAVAISAGDLLDALSLIGFFEYTAGTAVDFVWYAIFPPLAVVARARARGFVPPSQAAEDDPRVGSPLLTFAFFTPLIHFGLAIQGRLGSGLDDARRITAFVTLATLLVLIRWQNARLATWRHAMREELAEVRDRIHASEKLEALGRLAGGVAHDFNNKLAIVLGYVEILEGEARGRGELAEPVAAIRGAAEHLARVTGQLLAIGRRQFLVARPHDIDAALARLTPALRAALGPAVTLEVIRSARPVFAEVDESWLERALLHLATNAREAMPGGGRLRIETAVQDYSTGGDRRDPAYRKGRFVRIDVADDGPGLPAEQEAHLFEPFFTTKSRADGRGLGLASVRGIVEQCGGFVTAETAPGYGFVCRLHFPLAAHGSGSPRPPAGTGA